MKTRFDDVRYPLYCDAGPHEGDMRIDLTIRLYLSPREYARYQGPDSLRITLAEPVATRGTAEPSTGGRRPRAARTAPCPPAAPADPGPVSSAKEHSDGRPRIP